MVLEPPDVIEEEDLTDSDEAILDVLADGRLTKGAIVERTGLHRNTVRNRLDVLIAADAVDVVHKGTKLYELADDPRADAGDEKSNVDTRELVDDWLWEHYGFGVDTLDEVEPERAQAAFRHLLEARGNVDGIDDALDELGEALGVDEDV